MIQRTHTGVKGFDELVEKGFPGESLILIAGAPGAGKTTFSAQFLYEGAVKFGERGVYVCFAETKKSFLRAMSRFQWDFATLETEGRCTILDLSTVKEVGIQSTLDTILKTVTEMKAKRLVIDSFTAMSMAMKEAIDIRYLVHLLYKFLQRIGCTTILISDTPWGSDKIGSGIEEFIADGIVLMQMSFDEKGNLQRELRILKMRTTNHSERSHSYHVTEEGIVIYPSAGKEIGENAKN
jgi:circadian clock protein KaiC